MLRGPELALVLLWATLRSAPSLGQACLCTALQPAGLFVNCTFSGLSELPPLPSGTRKLHLQDNGLTGIPSGLFDELADLQSVSLVGNPFHCDCSIEYLRNWLLRNRAAVSQEPTCSSPSSVAQKAITELTDDYFIQCAPRDCSKTAAAVAMGVMLGCLVVLLLWSLRLAKDSTFTLKIEEKNLRLKTDPLRPLKVRHSRRESAVSEYRHLSTDDLGTHRINMELLPQVLDVFHKKHNIKFKTI